MTLRQYTIETSSEAETAALGRRIAPQLCPATVVPLYGDLGTGKTVLCRGIARGLGIEAPVTSPSFTVAQEYRRPDGLWLFHLDMYRIANEEDALSFGIEEFLFSASGVTLVEWPERIAGLLEEAAGKTMLMPIYLAHTAPGNRRIRVAEGLLPDDE